MPARAGGARWPLARLVISRTAGSMHPRYLVQLLLCLGCSCRWRAAEGQQHQGSGGDGDGAAVGSCAELAVRVTLRADGDNSTAPQCTATGEFVSTQCRKGVPHLVGPCWCVDAAGHELPGTRGLQDKTTALGGDCAERKPSNPFLGVVFHWLGGFAAGSFYVPYKRVVRWSWETYWLTGGCISWVVAPWLAAVLLTQSLGSVLSAQRGSTLGWAAFFGVLWGLGGATYGLTMRYLGISLGTGVALGYCAVCGTLLPPLLKVFVASVPVAQDLAEIAGSSSGQITLAGVGLAVVGIGAASVASFLVAVLTEIYLCHVCSCQEILRRNGRG
jgi:hypothetical protein